VFCGHKSATLQLHVSGTQSENTSSLLGEGGRRSSSLVDYFRLTGLTTLGVRSLKFKYAIAPFKARSQSKVRSRTVHGKLTLISR